MGLHWMCRSATQMDLRVVSEQLAVAYSCGSWWWLIGRFDTFRPKGRSFESRFSRHLGTLEKSFTCSYLWHFGMKLRHSIRAMLGVPLSSSGLEEVL